MWTKFIAVILFFLAQGFLGINFRSPDINVSMQDRAININQNILKIFNLGQKRMIVAFLWIKTLLDSDLEHYSENDLNNWMFHKLNSIITLDHLFLQAYQYAGIYLSIVKNDKLGAEYFYDKGLLVYPDNYFLLLNSAFHHKFELKKPREALLIYMNLIKKHKVPSYIIGNYLQLIESPENENEKEKFLNLISTDPNINNQLNYFLKLKQQSPSEFSSSKELGN